MSHECRIEKPQCLYGPNGLLRQDTGGYTVSRVASIVVGVYWCSPVCDTAWAAGFIDGEGSLYVGRKTPKQLRRELVANQITPIPLRRLQAMFGGRVNGPYPNGRVSPIWRWIVVGRRAEEAVTAMLPYFSVKGDKAKRFVTARTQLEMAQFRKDFMKSP